VQTHEIFPNLFLGGEHSSRRVDLLKKLGVKGIVNLSSRLGNEAPDQFEYLPVRIGDEPDVRIADRFEEVLTFIKKHHDHGDGVLVHCELRSETSA
jgi:protein-tyrosine phosphatase